MILLPTDKMVCPQCAAIQEYDVADDYAVPNRTGEASADIHECECCDVKFRVTRLFTGSIEVLEL